MPAESPFTDSSHTAIETERRRERDRQRMFDLSRRLRSAAHGRHSAPALPTTQFGGEPR